jgi:hypothetical protein
VIAYKLLRVRSDGTLGTLFINRQQVIPFNQWLQAGEYKTKGYALRPGWHATLKPEAPHLKMQLANGEVRQWYMVELINERVYNRPESQGGTWVLGSAMRVMKKA